MAEVICGNGVRMHNSLIFEDGVLNLITLEFRWRQVPQDVLGYRVPWVFSPSWDIQNDKIPSFNRVYEAQEWSDDDIDLFETQMGAVFCGAIHHFLFLGTSASGKSTLCNAIVDFWGDQVVKRLGQETIPQYEREKFKSLDWTPIQKTIVVHEVHDQKTFTQLPDSANVFMTSNVMPSLASSKNGFTFRVLGKKVPIHVWHFKNSVPLEERIPKMCDRMKKELPCFIQRCAKKWHDAK